MVTGVQTCALPISGYGTYLGTAELKDGALRIFPLRRFLKELASGHVLVA
jgi:hypothetical protein